MVTRYAHLSPKHQQDAINALGGFFGNLKTITKLFPNFGEAEERKVVGAT